MKKIILFLISFIVLVYLFLLLILPPVVSSDVFARKTEKILREKKDLIVRIQKVKLKTYPDLSADLYIDADIKLPYIKETVSIGEKGFIRYSNFSFYLKKFSVSSGQSAVDLDGLLWSKNSKPDVRITGDNLCVSDIHDSLLYFQKIKSHGEKVFIENFKDFAGSIDIKLSYKNNGLFGECIAKNLEARTVLFNVPIFFKEVVFYFNDREVAAQAAGKLGSERVFTSFILNEMAALNQEVSGIVEAGLNDKIVKEYLKDVAIRGCAKTSVTYYVKNKKIDVNYLVKLKSGSDIYYKDANLGLEDFDRRLFVRTHKEGDILKITDYDYSLQDGSEITNIILGSGLLKKEHGHFILDYITCKTNGYAPVSVTGSFGKYVEGGFFDGDLKYDAKKNIITGDFTIVDSNYKDFYLEKAVVSADDKFMKIIANGTYDDFPFNWNLNAENDFNKKIHIYDMELFLEEFVVHKGDYKVKRKKDGNSFSQQLNDIKISIDNWKIKLNKASYNRIIAENISLSGSLNDDIFNFLMSDVLFAKGHLNAKGWYNFANHSSCIDFTADNIDSNIVADVVFGLPDQISGLAAAKLHALSYNKLENIKANASFSIKQGYLQKLGSTEFIIKKSKKVKKSFKFKLSDIINVDISKSKALASDLDGSFVVDNYQMKDICLTSKQKYLSLFLEGDYNIDSNEANLELWGKYNKTMQKKVKILFIPLSWITKILFRDEDTKSLYQNKINQVPDIVANPDEVQAFRVKVNGNINDNNLKVQLKSIN